MILLWKSVSPLCSVSQWQGITLLVEFRDHAWRIALTNAALVPDGSLVKGAWPTQRSAQHEAEMTVERIVVGRSGHVQARQRPAVRSGGGRLAQRGRKEDASAVESKALDLKAAMHAH
jgi:hypothetical protein